MTSILTSNFKFSSWVVTCTCCILTGCRYTYQKTFLVLLWTCLNTNIALRAFTYLSDDLSVNHYNYIFSGKSGDDFFNVTSIIITILIGSFIGTYIKELVASFKNCNSDNKFARHSTVPTYNVDMCAFITLNF